PLHPTPTPPSCHDTRSAPVSTTTCTIPQPPRTTKNLTPPKRRSECSHPPIRTRSPTCTLTSTVCIRSIKKVPFKSSRQTAQQKTPILLHQEDEGCIYRIHLSWYHHHLPHKGPQSVLSSRHHWIAGNK